MIFADKVTFESDNEDDWTWETINQIHLASDDPSVPTDFYSKGKVYDFIEDNGKTIEVDIAPNPRLVTRKTPEGTKFVKSENDDTATDNLIRLGRRSKK